MHIYQYTNIENFEKEVVKASKHSSELVIQTDRANYETIKDEILDSCYNVEDYDKENNLLIVKWVLLDAMPVRKINNIDG